jgi:lipopolysaccharide/colanic/teichoic acid biosynthesis glycosyltransferase
VGKANLRLKRPSSHTRLLSRVAILDVLWGGITPLAAYLLRDGSIHSPSGVATYCGIAFLVSLLVFQWFQTSSPIARFYSIRDAFELLKACFLIAALTAVILFALTRLEEAPRSIPILHFLLLVAGLLGGKVFLRLREARRDSRMPGAIKSAEHVLLIQASRLAWFFTKMVEELAPGRYQIVAILDEEPKLKHRSLNGYPIIGAPADLEKVIADYAMHGVAIDKVVLAAQPEELSVRSWLEICRICRALRIGVDILPQRLMSEEAAGEGNVIIPHPAKFSNVGEEDLQMALNRPIWAIKRGIDIAVAGFVSVLLLPIIVVVCVLVFVDVGIPVVFWQRRVGQNGTPLHLYKFRTLHTLFHPQTKVARGAQEPSAIGRFLQRTRFDELPQLWNVLSGDMSLIGPRPLLPVDQPSGSTRRLTVRPGLTGWAQISGGKAVTAEEKNALDEWYIRHVSLGVDFNIAIRTLWMLFITGDRRDEKAIALALLECARVEPAGSPDAADSGVRAETKNEPTRLIKYAETASL